MKLNILALVTVLIIMLTSCTKEDPITISASSIEYIHEDGSEIANGECIDPYKNIYRLKIEIKRDFYGFGEIEKTVIEYSINGIPHQLKVEAEGIQYIPVDLVNGSNTALITGTSLQSQLHFTDQGDFELVE